MAEAVRDPFPGRSCVACGRDYTHAEIDADYGWRPTANGWECPACMRAAVTRIDRMARDVIASGLPFPTCEPPHRPHDGCDICDIARRVDQLRLSAEGMRTPLGA